MKRYLLTLTVLLLTTACAWANVYESEDRMVRVMMTPINDDTSRAEGWISTTHGRLRFTGTYHRHSNKLKAHVDERTTYGTVRHTYRVDGYYERSRLVIRVHEGRGRTLDYVCHRVDRPAHARPPHRVGYIHLVDVSAPTLPPPNNQMQWRMTGPASCHMDLYNGNKCDFEWQKPVDNFGADGFTITVNGRATAAPGSRQAIEAYVSGDFNIQVVAGNAQAIAEAGRQADVRATYSIKPSPNASGDMYLRIGAAYGPYVTYHFRGGR